MNYYDLTAGQRLTFLNQFYSIHKQINNICILVLVDKGLDLVVLRKAIETVCRQNDCFSLRMVKKDGKLLQYFREYEETDIGLLDFTSRTKRQMDKKLYQLARIPIHVINKPLVRLNLVKSFDGKTGIYICVTHLIMDAAAIFVFMDHVMSVYEAIKDDTPLPKPLYQIEPLIRKELDYPNTPQYQKDKEFWHNEIIGRGEPMYSHINGRARLEKNRRKNKNPDLRYANGFRISSAARHEVFEIPGETVRQIEEYCRRENISAQAVFMTGLRIALSKINDRQKDICFYTTVARRSTLQEKRSYGSRANGLPLRTVLEEDCTFDQACVEISNRQSAIYRHADFETVELLKMEREAYHPKSMVGAYVSMLFSYTPISLKMSDGTPLHHKWYCNGADAQSVYMMVMDADGTGALRCYYEYQYRNVKRGRILLLHSYILQSIQAGLQKETVTLCEIMNELDEQFAAGIPYRMNGVPHRAETIEGNENLEQIG